MCSYIYICVYCVTNLSFSFSLTHSVVPVYYSAVKLLINRFYFCLICSVSGNLIISKLSYCPFLCNLSVQFGPGWKSYSFVKIHNIGMTDIVNRNNNNIHTHFPSSVIVFVPQKYSLVIRLP